MVNENPCTSIEKECCGICGGRKHEVRLKFPDRRVLRCLTCRTIFSDLIWDPDRVRQLYETPDFFTGEYYRWMVSPRSTDLMFRHTPRRSPSQKPSWAGRAVYWT